jgi:hypothetical protein
MKMFNRQAPLHAMDVLGMTFKLDGNEFKALGLKGITCTRVSIVRSVRADCICNGCKISSTNLWWFNAACFTFGVGEDSLQIRSDVRSSDV